MMREHSHKMRNLLLNLDFCKNLHGCEQIYLNFFYSLSITVRIESILLKLDGETVI